MRELTVGRFCFCEMMTIKIRRSQNLFWRMWWCLPEAYKNTVCFNKTLTQPYYSSGNSSTTLTLSYSIEYLSRIIFSKCVLGGVTCEYCTKSTLRILHILDKKSYGKSRWRLHDKNRHETHPRFHVASNFGGKHKNPATRLFLL